MILKMFDRVIKMCVKILGKVCSKIPDCDTQLWWESKEEFEERIAFFEEVPR